MLLNPRKFTKSENGNVPQKSNCSIELLRFQNLLIRIILTKSRNKDQWHSHHNDVPKEKRSHFQIHIDPKHQHDQWLDTSYIYIVFRYCTASVLCFRNCSSTSHKPKLVFNKYNKMYVVCVCVCRYDCTYTMPGVSWLASSLCSTSNRKTASFQMMAKTVVAVVRWWWWWWWWWWWRRQRGCWLLLWLWL